MAEAAEAGGTGAFSGTGDEMLLTLEDITGGAVVLLLVLQA
jgi:hypothetical protein